MAKPWNKVIPYGFINSWPVFILAIFCYWWQTAVCWYFAKQFFCSYHLKDSNIAKLFWWLTYILWCHSCSHLLSYYYLYGKFQSYLLFVSDKLSPSPGIKFQTLKMLRLLIVEKKRHQNIGTKHFALRWLLGYYLESCPEKGS